MNADRLLALYDRVADAPDAVSRLRRFVLDLAVRGKLVEQDPADEPASELLKRMADQKARLNKVRTTVRRKAPDSDLRIPPFGIPPTWEWSVIESVAQLEMGQSPRSEHYNKIGNGLAFFQGKADFGTRHPTPRYWCTKPKKIAECGDILMSIRAPVGPTNVADQRCCIGRGLVALRPFEGLNREFMLLTLNCFQSDLASQGFGTTFQAITKKQLIRYGFPVPPLAEQHRIFAKVDELMRLCDQLEEAGTAREDIRDRLTNASLTRLVTPDIDAPTFRSHARFAVDALPALTVRADQVKHLRQTILNLAVRGKLVEQDPADEPLPDIDRSIPHDLEPPFQVPANWRWSRLRALGTLKGGGTPSKARGDFWNGSIPWVSPRK